jgi:spore germination cell wall hydrolase CwlJ-like protein
MRTGLMIKIILLGVFGIGCQSEEVESTQSPSVVVEKMHTVIIATPINPEVVCLALNIYHEARGETITGQVAVASVTLNRVKSARFPNTVCGVVYQAQYSDKKVPVRHKCQFSWYCDGKSDVIEDQSVYKKVFDVAEIVYNTGIDTTEGSLFYHAKYVEPYWKDSMELVMVADNHIFYRR